MLTGEQLERYKRNILLDRFGENGQEKLLSSNVLIIGAGGLGSSAAYYLAASGVGTLAIADFDAVELSNLQRQILHFTSDLGRLKALSAREKLLALNRDLNVEAVSDGFNERNAGSLVSRYDLVVDCSDNLATRFLLNETCVQIGKPFIYGGVLAYIGQVMTILPGSGPCLKCLFREVPKREVPGCGQLGVLGAVPGLIGTIQAAEAVKYLLGVGELLVGRLLTYDALTMSFFTAVVERDADCPSCGK